MFSQQLTKTKIAQLFPKVQTHRPMTYELDGKEIKSFQL
jgi:hypothetical protein